MTDHRIDHEHGITLSSPLNHEHADPRLRIFTQTLEVFGWHPMLTYDREMGTAIVSLLDAEGSPRQQAEAPADLAFETLVDLVRDAGLHLPADFR